MTDSRVQSTIAFARLPYLIRDAARDFQRLTGLTAVTTLGSANADTRTRNLPSPPLHPLCSKLLEEIGDDGSCEAEWKRHLDRAVRMQDHRIHVCPLGLRCASVPITLGGELHGLAKVVSGQEVSMERFRSLVHLLDALITRPCQDLHIGMLTEEIKTLQVSVEQLRLAKQPSWTNGNDASATLPKNDNNNGIRKDQALIRQVLDYLGEHYADKRLSLGQVARAVGRNEKYVTHLFAQTVGERMRSYITALRVRSACELLLETNLPINDISRKTGFTSPAQFRNAFRRVVGVTGSMYRQIFGAGAS